MSRTIYSSNPAENAELAAAHKAMSPAMRSFYRLPKAQKFQPLLADLIRYNEAARAKYAECEVQS